MPLTVTPRGTRGRSTRSGFIRRRLQSLAVHVYRFGLGRRMGNLSLLLLTTRGARSGKLHTVPVAWFPDDEAPSAWLVVASYAGAAHHPAWYLNMARNPDQVWIDVSGRRFKVAPRSLEGAERSSAWQRIVAAAPHVAEYTRLTDREIPVVQLTRTDHVSG